MKQALGRSAAPILAILIAQAVASAQEKAGPGGPTTPARAAAFDMSRAVACRRVDGLERYEPLPEAKLTSEDKLKVYFRPLRYKMEKTKTGYRAAFTEDGRIRRKGEKTALAKEDKLLEYEARFDATDYQIYLVNTIGLKDLPPGAYEFDITLHDALDAGSEATQTLPFTIVPLPKPDPAASKAAGPGEPEDPPGPVAEPKSKPATKRKAKGSRSPKPRG